VFLFMGGRALSAVVFGRDQLALAAVVLIGVAAAVAEEAGQRVEGAGLELGAEDVAGGGLGRGLGHGGRDSIAVLGVCARCVQQGER
jgi:hypothetical protein